MTEKGAVYAIREKIVEAQVGGISLEVVVDSGASCNVMDEAEWKECKSKNIKCDSRKTNKEIFAYAQNSKLKFVTGAPARYQIPGRASPEAVARRTSGGQRRGACRHIF